MRRKHIDHLRGSRQSARYVELRPSDITSQAQIASNVFKMMRDLRENSDEAVGKHCRVAFFLLAARNFETCLKNIPSQNQREPHLVQVGIFCKFAQIHRSISSVIQVCAPDSDCE